MRLAEWTPHIERLLQNGEYALALTACDEALRKCRPVATRSGILQLKARSLAMTSDAWEGPALVCLKEALSLTAPDSEERGQVHATFTAAHAYLQNAPACLHHRDSFVQILTAIRSQRLATLLPYVHFNLATAYYEQERLLDAEPIYRLAAAACHKHHNPDHDYLLRCIYHNLADVLQETDRYAEAVEGLQAHPLPDDLFGAQIQNRYALHALHTGNLSDAFGRVETGLAHPSCDDRTRAALFLTRAKIALAARQIQLALAYTAEAARLASEVHCFRIATRTARFRRSLPTN